jgi:hypothetical protein
VTEQAPGAKPEQDDASDAFGAYLEYNKILRTWFVAFGVGGPALFLVNEKVAERLAKIGELKYVATLFLIGAAAQIGGALLNKTANWYVYRSAWGDPETKHWRYKFANWLVEQFWIDVLLDIATIVCFGIAAWQLLTSFAPQG